MAHWLPRLCMCVSLRQRASYKHYRSLGIQYCFSALFECHFQVFKPDESVRTVWGAFTWLDIAQRGRLIGFIGVDMVMVLCAWNWRA
jgi:hypothetical protein